MSDVARFTAAAFVASLVPPLVISVYGMSVGAPGGAGLLAIGAWVVGLLHLGVFGVPAFVYLRRTNRLRWYFVALLGFFSGLLPYALLFVPSERSGYSSGANWHGRYVEFYQHGIPTEFAYFSFFENCALLGLYGVITALCMWATWLWFQRPKEGAVDA